MEEIYGSPRYSPWSSKLEERWSMHAQDLPQLDVGDSISMQDRHSNTLNRWACMGVIVEISDFDNYTIKLDGSRAVTRRNRRHMKKLCPDIIGDN